MDALIAATALVHHRDPRTVTAQEVRRVPKLRVLAP